MSTSGVGSSNHSLKTMNTAFNTWAMNVEGKMKLRLGELMLLHYLHKFWNG